MDDQKNVEKAKAAVGRLYERIAKGQHDQLDLTFSKFLKGTATPFERSWLESKREELAVRELVWVNKYADPTLRKARTLGPASFSHLRGTTIVPVDLVEWSEPA